MSIYTQSLTFSAVLGGATLPYVFAASGQGGFGTGWPTCRISVPTEPSGAVGSSLVVTAMGAVRMRGYCAGRDRSTEPPTVELLGNGYLAFADDTLQEVEDGESPEEVAGAFDPTDQNLVNMVLLRVAGEHPLFSFTSGAITGTGDTSDPNGEPWPDWREGQSAWSYIRALDKLTGYRTFQRLNGQIVRIPVSQASGGTTDFTFSPSNTLRGASGGSDRGLVRSNVATVVTDALSYGQIHTLSLAAHIGVSGPQWCQRLAWSIDAQGGGWTQTASHATE